MGISWISQATWDSRSAIVGKGWYSRDQLVTVMLPKVLVILWFSVSASMALTFLITPLGKHLTSQSHLWVSEKSWKSGIVISVCSCVCDVGCRSYPWVSSLEGTHIKMPFFAIKDKHKIGIIREDRIHDGDWHCRLCDMFLMSLLLPSLTNCFHKWHHSPILLW